MRSWAINEHLLCLSGGWMGAGHVPELCCAILGPIWFGGPSVLTQHQEGVKDLCAGQCSQGSGSLLVFTEIPQCLEKSFCAEIQSTQMKYIWLNNLHPSAVVAEIMKI